MSSAEPDQLPQTEPEHAGFVRTGPADAGTVSRMREEFARWLRDGFSLDAERFSDIVLAVYEAMSNVAEFAYPADAQDRPLSVRAQHDVAGDGLVVTVADRGEWRERDPAARAPLRGRGIPLMRALADRFTLEPSDRGTRVDMQFRQCAASAAAVTA